jgi:predicted nicotinamide N-methyase
MRPLRISTSAEAAEADPALRASNHEAFNVKKADVGTWTGGSVWESGTYLAQYLRGLDVDWAQSRVLELGTGTGLVGLTAAQCGAREVWLTDQVLHVARHNRDANFDGTDRDRVKLHSLRWGDPDAIAAIAEDGFDIILGSDIIYHAAHHELLAETIAALSKQGTVVLLCTPDGSPSAGYGSSQPSNHSFYNKMCAHPHISHPHVGTHMPCSLRMHACLLLPAACSSLLLAQSAPR